MGNLYFGPISQNITKKKKVHYETRRKYIEILKCSLSPPLSPIKIPLQIRVRVREGVGEVVRGIFDPVKLKEKRHHVGHPVPRTLGRAVVQHLG